MPDTADEILHMTRELLDAIARADWKRYHELCHPSLSAFEPEALGQLVEGLDFHQFYFKLGAVQGVWNTALARPLVRVMGDAAVIAYVRVNQRQGPDGRPISSAVEETRVWQKIDGKWKHVHFHRSLPT